MQVTLTREQYDAEIGRLLTNILDPEPARKAFKSQYPKPSPLAKGELTFRGIDAPNLPEREYAASELDAMVVALEACDRLTVEARAAAALGMTLALYRKTYGTPIDESDAFCVTDAGGAFMIQIAVDPSLLKVEVDRG